jgi:hypothetical protein
VLVILRQEFKIFCQPGSLRRKRRIFFLFVFNDTIEGPRAHAVKSGRRRMRSAQGGGGYLYSTIL